MTSQRPGAATTPPQQSPSPMQYGTSCPLVAIVVILALIVVGMVRVIWTIARLENTGGIIIVKLLIAIVLIIMVGNLSGWIADRCRQPRVVGEMVAGIALGPALVGHFAPELMPHLRLIAQLAIITLVFLVGAKLPLGLLRGSGRRVAALGVGMVAIPLLCGVLLAAGLSARYRPDGVAPVPFLLFIGTSMSVTAFPVLVRILADHDLISSKIGTLGLTAAGLGDILGWCLLAVVIATARGDSVAGVVLTAALTAIFAVMIWTVLRPALRQFLFFSERSAALRSGATAILLLSAISGAFITDWIGIHTIVGAFLVGLAVPRDNPVVDRLTHTIERGATIALPLFFTVIGCTVQIGFLQNSYDILVCALIIAVSMASKMGATALIARWTKLTWRESVGLGVMANCRGLTELVVISIGLSLGIIKQNMFVMFVVMTLVTTIITGPLLGRLTLNRATFRDREEWT